MPEQDDRNDSEGARVCSGCNTGKSIDRFRRDRSKRGGHATICRTCQDAYRIAWKARNPERIAQYERTTKERHGARYRAEAAARYEVDGAKRRRENRQARPELQRAASRRAYWKNPEKQRSLAKERYLRDPQSYKDAAKIWQKANRAKVSASMVIQNAKRRSRKKANGGRGFTAHHWHELVRRADGLCAYCRLVPSTSIDHFVPLKLGGQDDYANLVPACRRCNSLKNSHEPIAWVERVYGADRLAYVRSIMLV